MEAESMSAETIANKSNLFSASRGVLDKFTILAEGNEKQRLHETFQLLVILQKKQTLYKELAEPSGLCPAVEYTLTRLIKGLASNRKWARVGFATALTQLLAVFKEIELSTVLSKIDELLTFTKHESRGEKGSIQFGKVTALIAVIRSEKFLTATGPEIVSIVKSFQELKSKKSYLELPCVYGLEQLLIKIDKDMFKDHVLPELNEQLTCGWETADPNTLFLLLTCKKQDLIGKKFLKTSWGGGSVFDKANWPRITEIIKASSLPSISVHPVNHLLRDEMLKSDIVVFDFWQDSLVNLIQPGKKKLIDLAFFYLQSVIKTLTSTEQFLSLFSLPVMQALHGNLLKLKTEQGQMASSVVDAIMETTSTISEDHIQLSLLRHVIFMNFNFKDNILCKKLIQGLNEDDVREFSEDLMKLARGENISEDMSVILEDVQKWAVFQLKSNLLRVSIADKSDYVLNSLQFLLIHALFDINSANQDLPHVKPLSTPFNVGMRVCFLDCLKNAVTHLQQPGENRDLTLALKLLLKLGKYAESLLSNKSVSICKELPEEVSEELTDSLEIVAKLQKPQKTSSSPESRAFQVLFIHMALQLFMEPEETLNVIKDVHICYEKSNKKAKKNKDEEEPEWIDVLTELLISLMSQSSRLTRGVANNVFRLLSPHVTTTSLDLIINVLTSAEEDSEDGPIAFVDKEDSDEDDKEENIEKKLTPDLKMVENGNHSNADDDTSDDDDDESSEEEAEEVDEQLRQTVKAALGPAAAESDKEDEQSDDDDIGDEEMFRLDDALSEAFRSMQHGKSKNVKLRKQQYVTFRLRVLDLVETFIKTQPPVGLVVYLVTHILDVMESGLRNKDEGVLGKRANIILKLVINTNKKRDSDMEVDKAELLKKMSDLIEFSTKVSSLHMVTEVSLIFHSLMRLVLMENEGKLVKKHRTRSTDKEPQEHKNEHLEGPYVKKLTAMLKNALSDCIYKRNSPLHHLFFQEIIKRSSAITWPLSDVLLESIASDSVKVFIKTKCTSFLLILLSNNVVERIGNKQWTNFSEKFIENFTKVFADLKVDEHKPKFTLELLRLVFKMCCLDQENGKILVENIEEKLESLLTVVSKESKKWCHKILNKIRCLDKKSNEETDKSKQKRKLDGRKTTNESNKKSPRLSDDMDNSYSKKQSKSQKHSSSDEGKEDSSAPSTQEDTREATPVKKSKGSSGEEITSPDSSFTKLRRRRKSTRKQLGSD